MKLQKITFIILFVFFSHQNLICQKSITDSIFIEILRLSNVSFLMPDKFVEDLSFKKKPIFLGESTYFPVYQIKTEDDKILVAYTLATYTKVEENKINKLYPDKKIDLRTNHLNHLKAIESWNRGSQVDTGTVKNKIAYYDSEKNKKLGTDLSGEYLVKLKKPYNEEYQYLLVRFMTKYYRIWIYQLIFYKTQNEYMKDVSSAILNSIKIN